MADRRGAADRQGGRCPPPRRGAAPPGIFGSKRSLAWGLALVLGWAAPLAAAPQRVVSVNLCTDQLAMLLAEPGQLVSVSWLAGDPRASVLADRADDYIANRGGAEQVFLLRPDLVLAGTFTARPAVNLLRRLGIEVVELPPANRLADVAGHLRLVGAALGRGEVAEAMAQEFEAGLAELGRVRGPRFRAAMYYPNGYTTGAGTLADEILQLAGFENIGAGAGLTGGGILPLERLVMAEPELIVTSHPYPGASRSEEILQHPALIRLRQGAAGAMVSDADWICGLPMILNAVAGMVAAHRALEVE